MGKKALFVGLVSTVLAGASAVGSGCSAAADLGTDGGLTFDTGAKNDTGGGSLCRTQSDVFGTAGASTQTLNACTPTELGTLDTMIRSSTGTTYVALYGMVGASCQKCLFSSASDANWQSFVWAPDMQHVLSDLDAGAGKSTVFDNSVGACVAHVAAGGSSCGLAATHNDECYQTSCQSCASQSDFDGCISDPQTAAQCGQVDTRATDCMTKDQYNQALVQCGFDLGAKTIDFKVLLNVTCGTGKGASSDGGTDSGSDSGSTDAGPG